MDIQINIIRIVSLLIIISIITINLADKKNIKLNLKTLFSIQSLLFILKTVSFRPIIPRNYKTKNIAPTFDLSADRFLNLIQDNNLLDSLNILYSLEENYYSLYEIINEITNKIFELDEFKNNLFQNSTLSIIDESILKQGMSQAIKNRLGPFVKDKNIYWNYEKKKSLNFLFLTSIFNINKNNISLRNIKDGNDLLGYYSNKSEFTNCFLQGIFQCLISLNSTKFVKSCINLFSKNFLFKRFQEDSEFLGAGNKLISFVLPGIKKNDLIKKSANLKLLDIQFTNEEIETFFNRGILNKIMSIYIMIFYIEEENQGNTIDDTLNNNATLTFSQLEKEFIQKYIEIILNYQDFKDKLYNIPKMISFPVNENYIDLFHSNLGVITDDNRNDKKLEIYYYFKNDYKSLIFESKISDLTNVDVNFYNFFDSDRKELIKTYIEREKFGENTSGKQLFEIISKSSIGSLLVLYFSQVGENLVNKFKLGIK